MLNVDDLLLETEKDLVIDPLSIRLQGRAFVLLEDDRGFLLFFTFHDREAIPFFSQNPNSYISPRVRREERSYHVTLNRSNSVNLS